MGGEGDCPKGMGQYKRAVNLAKRHHIPFIHSTSIPHKSSTQKNTYPTMNFFFCVQLLPAILLLFAMAIVVDSNGGIPTDTHPTGEIPIVPQTNGMHPKDRRKLVLVKARKLIFISVICEFVFPSHFLSFFVAMPGIFLD
jgi:hypothetical protein